MFLRKQLLHGVDPLFHTLQHERHPRSAIHLERGPGRVQQRACARQIALFPRLPRPASVSDSIRLD
jgi:hypothetical protein